MTFTAATTTWDTTYTPKAVVSRDTDGALTVTLELEGLEPIRTPTSEENAAGISSFEPVTVTMTDGGDRPLAIRNLMKACGRGLTAAASSTRGGLTAVEMSMLWLRTSIAVRGALRNIDEDA